MLKKQFLVLLQMFSEGKSTLADYNALLENFSNERYDAFVQEYKGLKLSSGLSDDVTESVLMEMGATIVRTTYIKGSCPDYVTTGQLSTLFLEFIKLMAKYADFFPDVTDFFNTVVTGLSVVSFHECTDEQYCAAIYVLQNLTNYGNIFQSLADLFLEGGERADTTLVEKHADLLMSLEDVIRLYLETYSQESCILWIDTYDQYLEELFMSTIKCDWSFVQSCFKKYQETKNPVWADVCSIVVG